MSSRSATCSSMLSAGLAAVFLTFAAFLPAEATADVRPEEVVTAESKVAPLTYHYPTRYEPAIDVLEKEAGEATEDLRRTLGFEDFPHVDVWLLPEVDDYYEYHGEPNRAPEWAIGLSLSNAQTVVVARDPPTANSASVDMSKTFVHELAHVAMDIARDGRHVPRWFNEGFALMHAREWTKERSEQLAQAASTRSLMPLSDLDRQFPAHHNVASLAYAQSFHVVRYMRSQFGEDAFARILEQMRSGKSFDEAVHATTDRSLAALEVQWSDTLSGETSWLSILRSEFAWFFGAAVIFILIWFGRRLHERRGTDEMADDMDEEWAYDASRYPLPGDSADDSKT